MFWIAAKCAANAIVQNCKVLSCPGKCVLILGCKYQSKGHYALSRVWNHPFLLLGEVETRGSTHLDGKPLLQCKPSTSNCDATSEEKEKLRSKTLCKSF